MEHYYHHLYFLKNIFIPLYLVLNIFAYLMRLLLVNYNNDNVETWSIWICNSYIVQSLSSLFFPTMKLKFKKKYRQSYSCMYMFKTIKLVRHIIWLLLYKYLIYISCTNIFTFSISISYSVRFIFIQLLLLIIF